MDSLGHVNCAVIVVGKWIFDSNYKKYLPLLIESLNLICSYYYEENFFALSDTVFYGVKYVNPKAKNNVCFQLGKH